jgi:hypothetical protein
MVPGIVPLWVARSLCPEVLFPPFAKKGLLIPFDHGILLAAEIAQGISVEYDKTYVSPCRMTI